MSQAFAVTCMLTTAGFFAPIDARAQSNTTASVTRIPVIFSGGHETDPQDRGRPVVLIAGALGIAPEVFREAFSRVHPAPAGTAPAPDQVRKNKEALMSALGRYGITNEQLDAVSNNYRYRRERGEMWPTNPATAYALVQNGAVTGFTITSGGAGYSSPPSVSVPGTNGLNASVELMFSRNFAENGSVKAITVTGQGTNRVLPQQR